MNYKHFLGRTTNRNYRNQTDLSAKRLYSGCLLGFAGATFADCVVVLMNVLWTSKFSTKKFHKKKTSASLSGRTPKRGTIKPWRRHFVAMLRVTNAILSDTKGHEVTRIKVIWTKKTLIALVIWQHKIQVNHNQPSTDLLMPPSPIIRYRSITRSPYSSSILLKGLIAIKIGPVEV